MHMVTFVVQLADLKFLTPHDLSGGLSAAEIIDVIRKQFDYLPGDVHIEVGDDIVTIQFEGASAQEQTEARRLFEKAAKRAKGGEFRKAKDIYDRVLELDPAMADARREMAMTLFELGDMSAAKDQLIDALRLDPNDAWSYVVLGNIYVKHDRDLPTATRFFTRALELKPGDPYALNGLAAASQELGDSAKALKCFDEAITAHPEFANAWLGKAIVFNREDKPAQVIEVLDSMFSRAEMMDARSQPVFAEARKLYLSAQGELAKAKGSDVFKIIETYKADVASLSGYPVKVRTEPVSGQLSGVAQIAWKSGRDHHVVQISDRLAPPDAQHIEAHELTHIRLEALARKQSRNRWFATTAATRELAIRSLASDVKKLERHGYSDDSIKRVVPDLVGGLCGCISNTPLDMWIETLLHRDMPALRQAQFVSLHRLAGEALAATIHPEIRKLTRRESSEPSLRSTVLRHSSSTTSRTGLPITGQIISDSTARISRHVFSNFGKIVATRSSPATNTTLLMPLPISSACADGMNGNLIPAPTKSPRHWPRKARPTRNYFGRNTPLQSGSSSVRSNASHRWTSSKCVPSRSRLGCSVAAGWTTPVRTRNTSCELSRTKSFRASNSCASCTRASSASRPSRTPAWI